jgi:hypothetical protein
LLWSASAICPLAISPPEGDNLETVALQRCAQLGGIPAFDGDFVDLVPLAELVDLLTA